MTLGHKWRIESSSRALGSKGKEMILVHKWKSTLGRELWALNGKEMATNLEVDRKEIGSNPYTRNVEGRTTELVRRNMPQYLGCSHSLTLLKQPVNQSSVEITGSETDASWQTSEKIWTERTLYVSIVALSTDLERYISEYVSKLI